MSKKIVGALVSEFINKLKFSEFSKFPLFKFKMDMIRELNYACNADFFTLAYSIKNSIPDRDDRNRVSLWIYKIMKSNKTLSDLKLRNLFLRQLTQNVKDGKLLPPFHQDPPRTALKSLARQLPGVDESQGQDDEAMAMLRFLPAKHGGFLLPKPLPAVGAYVYVAATCKGSCAKCTFE